MPEKTKNTSFHGTYILLPVAILIISAVLAAGFYRLLPPEAAYHFEDGAPDRWMSRSAVIAWMVVPQFVLVVLGAIISGGAAILGWHFRLAESAQISKALLIMGNMVILPQLILIFAMLDIFLYNAYRIHLMPLWVFALIIMALGGIILVIFFIQILRQSHRLTGKNLQE